MQIEAMTASPSKPKGQEECRFPLQTRRLSPGYSCDRGRLFEDLWCLTLT